MNGAKELTLALRGKWFGSYGLCFCPAHPNTRTPALRLRDGDGGRLLAVCAAGCDFREIVVEMRARGLLDSNDSYEPDPAAEARRALEEKRERKKRVAQARRVFDEAIEIGGTLAERYLRNRAIRGPLPASLRFHPAAWHRETSKCLPAMVAAVALDGEPQPVAVHRTYLAEPGRKADIDTVKAMLGPVGGGAARLSEGAGPLIVAEGIETGFSLADAFADLSPRVWAALSASGISKLRLPTEVGELIIAPDGDATGMRHADALATRAIAAGWAVRVLPPPGDGLDWNDVARREVTA